MNFILDSSVALSWVLADEASSKTDALLDSLKEGTKCIVPQLLAWEVGNVLLGIERSKRASSQEVTAALSRLRELPIILDLEAGDRAWGACWELARKHQLTSYDAVYLELSMRWGLPLATLDKALRKAAEREGVKLLPKVVSN